MADGNNSGTKSIDELLADARKLKAQLGQTADDSKKKSDVKSTPIGDALNNVKAFNETAKEVHGGMSLVKETGKTVGHWFMRSWPVRAWLWAFKKICYKKDKETGERKLRPNRAKAMILTTAFMATGVIPGMIGHPARTVMGAVGEPIYDGARMMTMMHKDVPLYLNDEHVADHDKNIWVVKGTTKPNSEGETVLLKVKPSLAHDLWSWKNKGHPFFIPDQVVAPVAPGNQTQYLVTYYGVRWRIATWLQAYPELLDVKAVPKEGFNAAAQKQEQPKPAPEAQKTAPVQQQVQPPAPKGP